MRDLSRVSAREIHFKPGFGLNLRFYHDGMSLSAVLKDSQEVVRQDPIGRDFLAVHDNVLDGGDALG
jgi:hypothetical protein